MRRFCNMLFCDIKAQYKSGMYVLYVLFSVIYILLLSILPIHYRNLIASILIYSDPAALGLFFMGAVLLLEKKQKVVHALALSPLSLHEYMLSKITSFSFISILSSMIIALISQHAYPLHVLFCTFFASLIFSLFGFIIGTKIHSLNQYILSTVPIEMLCLVPAILCVFMPVDILNQITFYRLIIIMNTGISFAFFDILSLCFFILILYIFAYRCAHNMWKTLGGADL